MQLQNTKDYESFRYLLSNREVNKLHVGRLVKSIAKNNLLHLNPVIVNPNMEVIDGQHRIAAAELLGVPVYYQIDNNVSKKDLSDLNSVKKNWSTMDYINYWTIEKAPGFDELSKFLSLYPAMPPSTALMLLSEDGSRDINALKAGYVDTGNMARALELAEIIKKFRNIIDFAYDRNFILSIYKVFKTGKYDHEIMDKRLETQSRSLVKCATIKQYIDLIEEIYNKGSHNKVSFKYS
ncbi:MAG: ParB N-terminal domain-containing protein [Sphingobacteriaceae bacterium]|nr:ParB N-terminal domain-containing protein [Sphingobacteriaceae bacterium]